MIKQANKYHFDLINLFNFFFFNLYSHFNFKLFLNLLNYFFVSSIPNNFFFLKKNSSYLIKKTPILKYSNFFSYFKLPINQNNSLFLTKLFSLNNSTIFTSFVHFEFKNFFFIQYKKITLIKSFNYFNHWKNFILFSINFFYYNFYFFIFGSIFFKNEILSWNWNSKHLEFNNWKYFYNFFFFKNIKKTDKLENFFYFLKKTNPDLLIISDSFYHFKNIYFFNKCQFFTLALTPHNMNPWIFNFSLPSLNNYLYSQNIFFFFLNFAYKLALTLKFQYNFFIWKNI